MIGAVASAAGGGDCGEQSLSSGGRRLDPAVDEDGGRGVDTPPGGLVGDLVDPGHIAVVLHAAGEAAVAGPTCSPKRSRWSVLRKPEFSAACWLNSRSW